MWGGNSMIICAYILCLYLIVMRRRECKRAFFIIVPITIITCFIVYNPIIYQLALGRIAGLDEGKNAVYGRFNNLMMIVPVITIGTVIMAISLKDRARQMFFFICVILCFACFRTGDDYRPFSLRIDPYYKMTKDALYLEDYMLAHANNNDRISLCIYEPKDIDSYFDDDMSEPYYTYNDMLNMTRQYTPIIDVYQTTDAEGEENGLDYQFILCYAGKDRCDKIADKGYREIWTDGKGTMFEMD